MRKIYLAQAGVLVASFVGVSVASASGVDSSMSIVRGSVEVKQSNGTWASSQAVQAGDWIRSTHKETTVRLPGATVRLQPGAAVRLSDAKSPTPRLTAQGGKVFLKVDPQAKLEVEVGQQLVKAAQSEFILDANSAKLYVVSGQAKMLNQQPSAPSLKEWSASNKQVALDGPDRVRRNQNRRTFTQGEENRGNVIREESTPTTTPTYTPTPPRTPAFTPQPTTPPPQPQPQPTPPPQVGGGDIWPIVGGIVGGGVLIGLLVSNGGKDEDKNVNRPASP